jgi:thiol-disulfide isomerase/thioredoxin
MDRLQLRLSFIAPHKAKVLADPTIQDHEAMTLTRMDICFNASLQEVCQMRYYIVFMFILFSVDSVLGQQNPHGRFPTASAPQAFLFLIRDPLVLDDLNVSRSQQAQIDELNVELDPILWSMRNKGTEFMERALRDATDTATERLASILTRQQLERLGQIELRTLGVRAFLGEGLPDRLQLSTSQRQEIRDLIVEAQQGIAEIGEQVQEGGNAVEAQAKIIELRNNMQSDVYDTLSSVQKRYWLELLGREIDFNQLGRITFTAPDLSAETDWINSSPLTSEHLEGRVVALHFYAFGCVNCRRNFPWYKEWHEAFGDQGLIVLGVHTPETENERSVENVQVAALEQGLEYPIVVDNEKRNWNAWGNSMWPSTYLIDKEGRVRYWWYGELDWEGAGGQELLKTRIEELLEEE